MPRITTRLVILFATLAGVAAWVAFGDKSDPASVVAAASRPAASSAPEVARVSAQAAEPQSQMPERPALHEMGADPFSADVPQQTQVADAAPAAAARPAAPPLPYRFAGRMHIDGAVEVYLAKGDTVFPVKKGETLEGQYRVQKIGRTEMTLVHIASGTREKIEYGPPIREEDSANVAAVPETPAQSRAALPPAPVPDAEEAVKAAARRDYETLRRENEGG